MVGDHVWMYLMFVQSPGSCLQSATNSPFSDHGPVMWRIMQF